MKDNKWKRNIGVFLVLQVLVAMYSLGGLFSKLASNQQFMSWQFILYYGLTLLVLCLFSIGWQQILKYLPLVVAYSGKAAAMIWGLVWGLVFFDEAITVNKIIGVLIVGCGVYMVVSDTTYKTSNADK